MSRNKKPINLEINSQLNTLLDKLEDEVPESEKVRVTALKNSMRVFAENVGDQAEEESVERLSL